MALRNRDKKGYPQFTNRIIEWQSEAWDDGEIKFARVVGVDYNIGVTFVNATDPDQKLTCYNGPLSPIRTSASIPLEKYDKAFEYIIKTLRSNSIYNVQEIEEISGRKSSLMGYMSSCAFGV